MKINETFNWEDRYKKLKNYAVLDDRYKNQNINIITDKQAKLIFPIIKKKINFKIRRILDFGCGIGRFSKILSMNFNHSNVVAYDNYNPLIMRSNKNDKKITYIHSKNYNILNKKFDLIWINLVLGGINQKDISAYINKFFNLLKNGGYLILIENISDKNENNKWSKRTEKFYLEKFKILKLKKVGEFNDIDQKTGIFLGRKNI